MSQRAVERAYIGLGSNLAEPARQIGAAMVELSTLPGTRLIAASRLYGNPPMGPQTQPDYVNAVAALDTTLTPLVLLAALQGIEKAHGRVRDGERWGPRTLDLDLLMYGEQRIDEATLRVPHPGIAERAFVLVPLAEIAPQDLQVPGHGALHALLAGCDTASMQPLDSAA